LVGTLADGEVQIAGATLVDPHVDAESAGLGSGWRLEQRGIAIGSGDDGFTPVRREAGENVFGAGFGIDLPAVAVSGACLLVPSEVFDALGCFDTGYQFGLEDVDLCLRARTRGHGIACSGRTIVVHEGSSSQDEAGREFRRINRAVNRRRFRQLWGPALHRDRLEGLLGGNRAWGSGPHLVVARTSNDPAEGWGDYHTARELGEAAEALGWRVSYVAHKGDSHKRIPPDADVAVVLTDRWDARLFGAQTVTCAWIRNWTERWLTRPWLDRYDVLLASSGRSTDLLAEATGRPVELFPLATNQRRFRPPPPRTERALDWVLTANRWGEPRAIEPALESRSQDAGSVYGLGWQEIRGVGKLARGPIEYEQLPAVYASAKVVLDDTAEPTLAYDAVNSRVFDALAAGALVLTNCEAGVRELFDEEFPTWSSAPEVDAQLDRLLAGPAERERLVRRYRRTVLQRHTYEDRARQLRRIVAGQNEQLSFCLKIGAPDWEQAERWGDLHFAAGLGRALRRLGHRWHVDILPDWQAPASSAFDVVIHLRGRSEYSPSPGQFNVLWLISHPETFNDALADGFDLVCVASAPFAASLRERIAPRVQVLEQATDPRLFYPEADPGLAHELVFVGNSRGAQRKLIDDLLPTAHDLAVWGGGWRGTPAERHLVGEFVPNDELRRVYSSASIVLCDHWPDMRANGFRSNRVYDALACGGLVISDRVVGLDGSLGEAVLTYEDRAELGGLIDRLLGDPDERARRALGARERILDGETFDDRARALVGWVEEELARGPESAARTATAAVRASHTRNPA
jgi:glycosyltransferase involved in cell wall biosynthesis